MRVRVIKTEQEDRCPICLAPFIDEHYDYCQAVIMHSLYKEINSPEYDWKKQFPRKARKR